MTTFYILLAFLAGCGLPLQAAANARLSKALASPFSAATLQLGIAAALLLVLAIASGEIRAMDKLARAEWWQLSAGLASAAYVVAGIALFPRLGAVATVGLFIAGQALASLMLDGFGLFGIARRVPGPIAWLGTACVAAGILLIVRGQRRAAEPAPLRMKTAWVALGAICGGLLPVQGALNAVLARAAGAPLAVSLTSFVVAAAGMAVVLVAVIGLGIGARPRLAGLCGMPWWGWLGGLVGAAYVTTVFMAMPVIGAAATVGFTIAGQQIVSMLIDRFGWLGLPRNAVSRVRLAGAMVLLAGVVSIKLF